ncbi:hypothetical protein RND81_12G222800 [Saponaria officinalis]|uniref:glutathione transferase n=1 Tax=Saponaria officinalis TaxID=3572 RepID=A0AAW1HDW8_SAPOF
MSIEEDLWNKSELLLKMNPVHEKIPILVHNNKPICESLVIVEYIDEMYASARKIYTSGADQDAAKKEFIEILKVLEQQFGDKTYFGGDTFGYVDVALIPFYSRFYALETFGNFKIEESCPKIVAWAKRCTKRESVAKALPDEKKVYEFILDLKKKLGY